MDGNRLSLVSLLVGMINDLKVDIKYLEEDLEDYINICDSYEDYLKEIGELNNFIGREMK